MIPWVTYVFTVACLVAIAMLVLERAATAIRLPTRFLWAIGLGAAVVLPLATLSSAPQRQSAVSTVVRLPAVVVSTGAQAEAFVARHLPVEPLAMLPWALAAWIAWSSAALLRIVIGLWRLRRARRSWASASLEGRPVRVAPDTGPAAIGIRRREIVIPEWVVQLDAEDRALVLAHEQAHLDAHDPALRLGAALAVAALPWNPAVRWLEDRLLLAMERDCDARVLSRAPDPRAYAHLLVRIVTRSQAPALLPALSESVTHLERRISAMRPHHHSMPRLRAAVLAVLGGTVFATALLLPEPASAGSPVALAPNPPALPATLPAASSPADRPAPLIPRSPSAMLTAHDTTYREHQVDTAVGPRTMTPPVYPAEQRAAGVDGEVIVEFVVDATGAIDTLTTRVLRSNHAAFTSAVMTSLATATFKPAWKAGKPVRQVVQMPFVFRVGNP